MTDDRKRQAPKLPPIVPTYADPCGDDRARSARGTPPASAFEAYTGKPSADAIRQRMRGHVAPPLDIPPLAEAFPGTPAVRFSPELADDPRKRHPGEPRIAEHGTTAAERQRRSRAAREEAGGRQVAVMLDHETATALGLLCGRWGLTQTQTIARALVEAMSRS